MKEAVTPKKGIFFLFILLAALLSPVLFFGKIFTEGDVVMYSYPAFYFLQHHLGESLNSLSLGGYPIAVAFHVGFFNPLYQLFVRCFDFLFAYHFILLLDYFVAVFFTYLLARKLDRSVYGALITTVAFVFGQWSLYWLPDINIAHVVSLMPVLMFSSIMLWERKFLYTFLVAAFVGFNLLGTHYQYIMLSLMLGGVFFLFVGYKKWQKDKPLSFNVLPFACFTLACLAGFALGAQQFLETFSFFPETTRAVSISFQSVWYMDLLKYLVPNFDIPGVSIHEFFPYIGIAPLFFAIVALCKVRKEKWGPYGKFFVWAFIVGLVMTLKYSPLFLVLKHIPLMNYFAQPARWLYIGTLGLAVIAGYGFDYFIEHSSEIVKDGFKRSLRRTLYILAGIVGAANILYLVFKDAALSVALNYFDAHLHAKTTGLPLDYYHDLIRVLSEKVFYNVSLLNPHIWIFLVSIFVLYLLLRIAHDKILFSNYVFVFSAVSLILTGFIAYPFGDRDIILKEPVFATLIKNLEKSDLEYRVFSYLIPFAQYQKIQALNPEAVDEGFEFAREAFAPNLHLFSDIPILGGYEPMGPRRYQNLLFFLENALTRDPVETKAKDFAERLQLLGMMNAKYVVSAYELNSPKLKLLASQKVTRFDVPLYLYANGDVLPRIYLANTAVFQKENAEEANFKELTEFKGSFKDATFIECDSCEKSAAAPTDALTIMSHTAAKLILKTSTKNPRWIFFGQTLVPGWSATVDGKPVQIHYANYAFQAVKVEAGEHAVEFGYEI